MLKARIVKDRWDDARLIVQCTFASGPQAAFAMDLMKHLAIAAACQDGEDSAGRQKLRLLTPEEIVDRANQIADFSFEAFRTRGWLLDLPEIPETKPETAEPTPPATPTT